MTAESQTLYSDYGQSRTHSYSLSSAGTLKFEVDGIAINKTTDWYVNSVWKEQDKSGLLATDPNFSWAFQIGTGTTTIQARIFNSDATLKETHTWSVTTTPSTPSGPTPANGATVSAQPSVLDWADASGATSYDVWVNGSYRANVAVSQWAPNFAFNPGPHTWYVIAKNAAGSVTGPTWSFTRMAPPSTPSGPSPANGATVSAQPSVLDWADASGATSYDVWVNGSYRANVAVSQWAPNFTFNPGPPRGT